MEKEITTRNRGDFFVVLFGNVGNFVILDNVNSRSVEDASCHTALR